MSKNKASEYSHSIRGDTIKVEIRDCTHRILYKTKFSLSDKNAIISLLSVLEKYSCFSMYELIKEKAKVGGWW